MALSSQSQSSQSGELTSADLQEVFEALYSIAPNYVNVGLNLNVPLNTILEKPYANPYDCLLEILDYRLKQLPLLTWHDIVRALQSPTVQQHDLARTIESQYITASQSPASVSRQASAESSHAVIHTSGAQPSTHAPPQPPLHTVAAASVPLTHTPIALPQPSVDGTGQWPLTSNDLPHLLNILNPVASKCYYIGLQLGVNITQIANIEFNYRKCEDQLREILIERLKQEPPLTWYDIVTALRADSVREYFLACKIESKYILPLHPPTPQVSTDASMSPATECMSSHAPLQPSLPASVPQQASTESSHAAIHTSGAQPSTYAPPQPPLHTVAAASVTHTPVALPQPPVYSVPTGHPRQLYHTFNPNQLFSQPSVQPNTVSPYPTYNFQHPFHHHRYPQYYQPQLPPQPPPQYEHTSTVSHSQSHHMPSYSGWGPFPYGCPPHMFTYTNQQNQTPLYPAPIPSFPNLQPVEPNTQSSRGQTSNSQTQVPSQEPQSLSISTGDNSASVEDGNDCHLSQES